MSSGINDFEIVFVAFQEEELKTVIDKKSKQQDTIDGKAAVRWHHRAQRGMHQRRKS